MARGQRHLPTRSWRLKRMGTAGLGLFALVLQLALAFGHVHARELMAPRAFAAGAAVSKSSSAPAQIPSGLPDDDCPLCATMHMAASGLPPLPLSIAAPPDFAQVQHRASLEAFGLGVTRHVLFQTRAPPIA
jgi:hypothetical protein